MTPTLTLADELLTLALKATPGPWESWNDCVVTKDLASSPGDIICDIPRDCFPQSQAKFEDNSAYIVACNPTNITALCNAVKELSAENERLREALMISDQLLSKGHTGHSIPLETLRASFERSRSALETGKRD